MGALGTLAALSTVLTAGAPLSPLGEGTGVPD